MKIRARILGATKSGKSYYTQCYVRTDGELHEAHLNLPIKLISKLGKQEGCMISLDILDVPEWLLREKMGVLKEKMDVEELSFVQYPLDKRGSVYYANTLWA